MVYRWGQSTKIIVAALSLVFLGLALYTLRSLLGSLVLAGLLAYTLNIVARRLARRTRLSRRWAANIVFFLVLLLLLAMPGTLVPVAISQFTTLTAELEVINSAVDALFEEPILVLGRAIRVDQMWDELTAFSPDFGLAAEGALTVLETTSVGLLRLVIAFVTGYYLLMDWPGIERWLLDLLPEQGRPDAKRLLVELDLVWRSYIQGTLALMLIMGVVFVIIGLAIGLPGAIALGVVTGLLSMIPELGPAIAGALSTLVALFVGSNFLPIGNFWFAVLVLGIYIVVMQIKALWLRPQVMGRFMHMNTGLVFLAIVAAVMLQGIMAAFVVLPVLATAGVIGRYVRARLLDLDPWPAAAAEGPLLAASDGQPVDVPQHIPVPADGDES
jgi:predicted PurR-regulated permease PerM